MLAPAVVAGSSQAKEGSSPVMAMVRIGLSAGIEDRELKFHRISRAELCRNRQVAALGNKYFLTVFSFSQNVSFS
jgi:hypothetical protein